MTVDTHDWAARDGERTTARNFVPKMRSPAGAEVTVAPAGPYVGSRRKEGLWLAQLVYAQDGTLPWPFAFALSLSFFL